MPLYSPTPSIIKARSAAQFVSANSVAEQTALSASFAAGEIGTNGIIRGFASGTCTSSANNKTFGVKLGSTYAAGPIFTTNTFWGFEFFIKNVNSAAVQSCFGMGNRTTDLVGTSGFASLTENTANAITLALTLTKALGTETFTLDSAMIELIAG